MRKLIFVALAFLAQPALAKPYFRYEPLSALRTAAYFKVGTPVDNVLWGMETTVLKHHAEDGYILIPGVGWSLLDVGYAKPANGHVGGLVLGPSVDISEPMKALLLKGLDRLSPDKFQALRFILQPWSPDRGYVGLSLGPSIALEPGDFQSLRAVTGRFVFHAGLVAKF